MADHSTYELARFHEAQAGTYSRALGELKRGRKETHWMWFIFPQFEGLGLSAMSQRYAIRSRGEARAYLADPILGGRLRECVAALLAVPDKSAHAIMGSPDDRKLQSCLTLFAAIGDDPALFEQALSHFYDGVTDQETLKLLSRHP
ncbi:DUF1810 domain-containing protein [Mycoplana rhizolycopersici]|uniref:DUF1810 domain-containing protein n=1 Tax=Mycoplana rhizolycopersici TaxID=2746702 RepID=A0ABX2QF72_9HYPH|nr:DUF1810 domain-containing protein [Rhizobium rhizolycopersici]NVP55278.1 DUF1810 domain-containing protein [Rhizobium rhizolycopersici]